MTTRTLMAMAIALGLAAAGGYGIYRLGISHGRQIDASATAPAKGGAQKAGDVGLSNDRKVLYWHDPMVPGQKFDKPGKSPFMDMQLVPVYADGGGDEGKVTISPRLQQNLGVRTVELTWGALKPAVEAVGSVAYNERDVALVQARTNGYVEKLHVRAPLDPVKRGQPLAELYAPEWVAAQEEYLTVRRMAAKSAAIAPLLDGARQRMRLAGMTDDHIRLVETTGEVQPRLSVTAPIGGVVAELYAREGMTVMSGAPLFRINGLGTVWVNAEVNEAQAGMVRAGNAVASRTPALPGEVFRGRVNAILPEVNPATRTLKARVELNNRDGRLLPGMFVRVDFAPAARKEALLVPTEAVIQTGTRTVVIVAEGDGRFAPVEVELGMEANGQSEIRKGLQTGQRVVVSGQFLLDSEASLKATTGRMSQTPASGVEAGKARREQGAEAPPAGVHKGTGRVSAVDRTLGFVELDHDPIASLKWPRMTMGFFAQDRNLLRSVRKGDRVEFELYAKPDKKGDFVLRRVGPERRK